MFTSCSSHGIYFVKMYGYNALSSSHGIYFVKMYGYNALSSSHGIYFVKMYGYNALSSSHGIFCGGEIVQFDFKYVYVLRFLISR